MAGKLSDKRFAAMSRGYEEEQHDLKEAAETLRKEIEVQEQQNQSLDLFIERIQKYSALDELTPYVAHELIKAIYVGAPDKSSGKRRQSIHIEYDLIGFIPLNELMKQETAWPMPCRPCKDDKTILRVAALPSAPAVSAVLFQSISR